MSYDFTSVIADHPVPWRVTDEYKEWLKSGSQSTNPPAIVDALWRNLGSGIEHADWQVNDQHVVVSSSEWLNLDADVAELIVAAVNEKYAEKAAA